MPVAEIKKEKEILDQQSRMNGFYRVMNPRDLGEENKIMQNFMVEAKNKFGLKHYFTADFVVTPFAVYLLEIDALPALDEQAILQKSLATVGSNMQEFLDHIITQAIK